MTILTPKPLAWLVLVLRVTVATGLADFAAPELREIPPQVQTQSKWSPKIPKLCRGVPLGF